MRVFSTPKCSALGQDSFWRYNPQDYCPTKRHLAGIKKTRVYLQAPTYIKLTSLLFTKNQSIKKGAEWPLPPKLKTKKQVFNKVYRDYSRKSIRTWPSPASALSFIEMISTSQEFSAPHGIMLHPTISKNRCMAPIYCR